ncbi:MAG: GNAT family N-acetyltransferase [Halobacteriales archaeon]|nr:GNAT family N-acetyltransferase [Halobacteriales archaeon]
MDVREVTLRGAHVRLQPLRPEHARELWPAAQERDVWRYMPTDVRRIEDLESWVAARIAPAARGEAVPFLQRDARTGQAIGSTSIFDIAPAHKRMEIGHTWLGASHRRTACNTESKLLLLTHGFEALGANRVQLKTDARNLRSQQAIARIGAVREGTLRQHTVMPDGFVRDTVMFSVVRAEWPGVRARLQALLAR